jgi:ribonuclease HI
MEKKPSKLYSDGACRGNPGVGGAGAVIIDEEGSVLWKVKNIWGIAPIISLNIKH